MHRHLLVFISLVASAATLLLLLYLLGIERRPNETTSSSSDGENDPYEKSILPPNIREVSLVESKEQSRQTNNLMPPEVLEVIQLIQSFLHEIERDSDQSSSVRFIQQLFRELDTYPRNNVIYAIFEFLKTGADISTNEAFRVAVNGTLSEHPTLRVALLDYVGQRARNEISHLTSLILKAKTTPFEWAVALRNYAWATDPQTDAILRSYVFDFVSDEQWRKEASSGYCAGYDLIVATRAHDLIPTLSEYLRDESAAVVQRISWMALDQLAMRSPSSFSEVLINDPSLLQSHPLIRATLFARCDPRDPGQMKNLERYLLNVETTKIEIQKFVNSFPLYSQVTGFFLVSELHPNSLSEQAMQDLAALELAESWLSDKRFAELSKPVELLVERLSRYVSSAKSAGFIDIN